MKSHIITINLAIFLWPATSLFSQTLKGVVLDKENKAPIANCNIYITELQTGGKSLDDGSFELKNLPSGDLTLQFSSIGYEGKNMVVKMAKADQTLEVFMEARHIELNEVTVSVPVGKVSGENVTPVEKRGLKELINTPANSLMEGVTNLSGVDQISTGTGIGKPVIRGLSGNRVVVYSQGMRIENQQWGDEHGLGIGAIGIRDVELIKGPASLLYGSDAIGGVLYFNDENYAAANSVDGFLQTTYLSNAQSTLNGLGLKINQGRYKQNFFAAFNSHADYSVPDGDRVVNTRFDEKNLRTSLGYNNDFWVTNLRYSYLENNFGITEEDSLYHSSTDRNSILPYQNIRDHQLTSDNIFFIGKSKLELVLGYINNRRREFEESADTAALDMALQTANYNIRFRSPISGNVHSVIVGLQGMYQTNVNSGEEALIPDAVTIDNGMYALWIAEWEKLGIQAGMRWDQRSLSGLETTFGAGETIPSVDRQYANPTWSAGAFYKISNNTIRLNLSSAFRAPNTGELLSDGVHEGSNRYEVGNLDLKSEQATQVDFSYTYGVDHLEISINPFYNAISNYISLNPTDSLKDGSQVFVYAQQNSVLYGGEASIHLHPHFVHWLHFESAYTNITGVSENGDYLALMPANKLNSTLKAELKEKGKFHISEIFLEHILKFRQVNTAPNETATPQYQVLNAGILAKLPLGNAGLEFSAGVKNMLNSEYIDHLSRLKNYGVFGQGRNFYVGIRLYLN